MTAATIVEFLTARLDEDKADALATGDPRDWYVVTTGARDYPQTVASLGNVALICETFRGRGVNGDEDPYVTARHIARWSTKRALAEVEAKRRILARHRTWSAVYGPGDPYGEYCVGCGVGEIDGSPTTLIDECPELCDLAAVYASHADYDPSWAPETEG